MKTGIPSPARSRADPALITPPRYQTRRTSSVVSPARSTASGRLSTLAEQLKDEEIASFVVSPVNRRSVLSDNTDIDIPGRKSWWKKLDDTSREVMAALHTEKVVEVDNVLEEYIHSDGEVLSQEKKNYSLDLPESSGSDTIDSIVLPQRKLFTQRKENIPEKRFGKVIGAREVLAKQQKSKNAEKSIHISPKKIFGVNQPKKSMFPTQADVIEKNNSIKEISPPTKKIFGREPTENLKVAVEKITPDDIPNTTEKEVEEATTLKTIHESQKKTSEQKISNHELPAPNNTSVNKTGLNLTKELAVQVQGRNLFGNRGGTKRKNIFADFKLDDTEDDIPEIQPKIFGFQRKQEPIRRVSTASRGGRDGGLSPTSSIATDIEMDDWKLLPSSTMIGDKLDDIGTPIKKMRLSKITAQKETLMEWNDEVQDDIAVNKTKQPNKSLAHKSKLGVAVSVADRIDVQTDKEKEVVNDDKRKQVDIHNKEIDEQEKEITAREVLEKSIEKTAENSCKQQVNETKTHKTEVNESNEKVHSEDENELYKEVPSDVPSDGENVDKDNQSDEQNEEDEELAESAEEIEEVEQSIELQYDDESNEQDEENNEQEEPEHEEEENDDGQAEVVPQTEELQELPNISHDTTGRFRNKNSEIKVPSPEPVRKNISNLNDSFNNKGRNTSIRKTKSMIKPIEHNISMAEVEDVVAVNRTRQPNKSGASKLAVDVPVAEAVRTDVQTDKEKEVVNDDKRKRLDIHNKDTDKQEKEITAKEVLEKSNEKTAENPCGQQVNETKTHKNSKVNDQAEVAPQTEELQESPNISHDTTGRFRNKNSEIEVPSPEPIRTNISNLNDSFNNKGRNTSIRKTKSMIKPIEHKISMASIRESIGTNGSDSSAQGSGWDSHRVTKQTIRQTFGKGFTPRKSLRALVLEQSSKRQTVGNVLPSESIDIPQANSTEYADEVSAHHDVEMEVSDHEISRANRLEVLREKLKQVNRARKQEMKTKIQESLKASTRGIDDLFKVPLKPSFAPRKGLKGPQRSKPKPKEKPSAMPLGELPAELIEELKYKPPKRFAPSNASWTTNRLYKFLETKLEPKYDYKARVRAERLMETLYNFTKLVRKLDLVSRDVIDELKEEMARLKIVTTHFEFYEFFHEFMPREIRTKVIPDAWNKYPLPRRGIYSNILPDISV